MGGTSSLAGRNDGEVVVWDVATGTSVWRVTGGAPSAATCQIYFLGPSMNCVEVNQYLWAR
jgi:hypothetical protein